MKMTQQKKKVTCCGCFAWLFARRAHHSASEDLDSIVEDKEIVGAQDIGDKQGQGSLSLAPLRNAAQPLTGVEEELPSETLDADGDALSPAGGQNSLVVGKKEMAGNSKGAETLIITIHMIKRQVKEQETVAEKDWKQEESDKATGVVAKKEKESHGKRVETLIIILHMVKREKIMEVDEELPSEHQGTTQPHEGVKEELSLEQEEGVAVTEPPEKLPLRSSLKKKDAHQNPAKKTVRFSFQNLNTFVKDRELYCGYDYFKYGFPLSMIRSELQKLKERTVKPQKKPAKEAVNKLPEPQQTVTEKTTDSDNKNTEPQHLTGILKKGKTPSTVHKCLRFNFQNLNTFVKDREQYCGYDYFKYGVPLSSIRSQPQKLKERTVKPQEGPVKDAVNKHNTLQKQTLREAGRRPLNTTIEGRCPKGILKKEKMPRSTCPKHVRFNLDNLRAPEGEVYRGYDYFRYAAPLEATQSPNFTSRPHHQSVRSASNSLRGAPRHLRRPTQRSNDSFQQNSARNAAHSYTNSRHSQHRQHNSSSHVSPRYETRHFYEGQTNPGTNSRSRRRVKRGAKPSGGDVL